MVNPVLTILFDIFLIGSATAVIAALVYEQRLSRLPRVGAPVTARNRAARPAPSNIHRYHAQRRRAA